MLDTFWPAGNETLLAFIDELCSTLQGPGCWISGAKGTGKSHLLQAICERVGADAAFLPMADLQATGPGVLDGMAARRVLCLDDVERAAGRPDWERALFRLYNDTLAQGHVMVVSSVGPPRDCAFRLADLESRFTQLPAFRLSPLGDHDLKQALKLRARHRGLELPDEAARYLLTRQRRDMAYLYALLDRLDAEALAAQRRLTVPFVKSIIDA